MLLNLISHPVTYIGQSPRSVTSKITRKGLYQKKENRKWLSRKRSVFACSKNSLVEHSSWRTSHISHSLTLFLTIIVATTQQNLPSNSILKQNSKTVSSVGLRAILQAWGLGTMSSGTGILTRVFDVFSSPTFVTITMGVIMSFGQIWPTAIISKSFSATSISKTSLW